MTFGAVFPRVLRPVFGPGLAVSAAAANWWEAGGATGAVAVYQPKGAASLAASYSNLANPGTYDAAPGVAPTWASGTGWTFAGTQYLKSGITPADGYSVVVRVSNYAQAYTASFGTRASSTARFYIMPNTINGGGSSIFAYASIEQGTGSGTSVVNGVLAMTKDAGYKDGVIITAISSTWVGAAGGTVYIGARDRAGAADYYMTGDIQAIAIYNTTLTAPQVAAVSAAMAAL